MFMSYYMVKLWSSRTMIISILFLFLGMLRVFCGGFFGGGEGLRVVDYSQWYEEFCTEILLLHLMSKLDYVVVHLIGLRVELCCSWWTMLFLPILLSFIKALLCTPTQQNSCDCHQPVIIIALTYIFYHTYRYSQVAEPYILLKPRNLWWQVFLRFIL